MARMKSDGRTSEFSTVMNLALRGIEADFGPPAVAGPNTLRREPNPDLRANGSGQTLSRGPSPVTSNLN